MMENKKESSSQPDHKTVHYLKEEVSRLHEIDTFYAIKVENLKDYPQSSQLLEQRRRERDHVKKEILEIIKSKNSIFSNFLKNEFNKVFNSSGGH